MQKRKTEIISEWVNQYSDILYTRAFNRVGEKSIAQDIVQDTYVAAINGLNTFNNDSNIKTWLFSILNNKVALYFRKKFKMQTTLINQNNTQYFDNAGKWLDKQKTNWENEEKLINDSEFNQVFNACLSDLPSLWRVVIKSKFYQDKKGSEICDELNITESNYWQLVHRSKLQLRNCLTTNWFNK